MSSKSPNVESIKGKLLQGAFMNNGPALAQLSDPIADTPMVVTLDQLRPYEHNPRLNRNPLYDQLKESIRKRGLDAPPPITRRPGGPHFIIRNGGNTRLAILKELWTETRDERFLKISCLFRPWPSRGDIVALTGHLAENDMHGELTFIERALGVERARELYEVEAGGQLTQRELAQRLADDGYPVSQPHISKMQDAVTFLLPAIPKLLYAGLGKPQIERLTALRRSGEKVWQQYAEPDERIDFASLFQDVLATFDEAADFKVDRFQDELIHQMQQPLGKDYNWLKLDLLESRSGTAEPPNRRPESGAPSALPEPAVAPPIVTVPAERSQRKLEQKSSLAERLPPASHPDALDPAASEQDESQARVDAHVITPIAGLTERTQAMKRQLAQATGEPIPDFAQACLHAIPVQVGGLHPITDLWYIERQIDEPDTLRQQITGLVSDIVEGEDLQCKVEPSDSGIGFLLDRSVDAPSAASGETLVNLLDALSGRFALVRDMPEAAEADFSEFQFAADLGQLLLGRSGIGDPDPGSEPRIGDEALVKLFRVIRLARRLIDLEMQP
jgi:ParB family protein of integrating conjugative element (PFGI_1 class)